MNFGLIAIALSILCLIGSFAFAAPPWVNLLGIGFGLVGLLLIGRGRKGPGGGADG